MMTFALARLLLFSKDDAFDACDDEKLDHEKKKKKKKKRWWWWS